MRVVDFYYDYLSPFAYLASVEIADVCRRGHARLVYRPILFPALLNHWGQRGPAEIPPKARHTLKECLRYALPRGIPLRAPRLHPFNPLLALRVTCAADSEAERRAITHALFALGWVQGGDLSAPEEIAQALSAAGLRTSELMELAQSPALKKHLREQTDAAIARGVFGVPTMLVDDELFWGVSQLPNLELYLTDRDPLTGLDPAQFVSHGVGAWRPGVPRS